MCSMEAWKRHLDDTEVCEKNGQYYLKTTPEKLYGSYEEAHEYSEFLRNIIIF